MNGNRKKLTGMLTAIITCMALLMCNVVEAAELESVMNVYTGSDSISLFIKNPGKEVDYVYIGNDEAEEFLEEEAGPIRTVVLLDNSLSIHKKYRETIKTFLTDITAAGNDGDTFTIAAFDKNVTYLVRDSNDYLDIKSQIEALEFVDQESYFTNALYTVMNDISNYDEIKYTRVIVIADGVDNEALGYTDDELIRKIQMVQVPIYTIGCSASGNEENLKKMFSLSRMSNARSYLWDDYSGTEILKDIISDSDVKKISIVPQDKSCDGSEQTIRVCFGEDYCIAEAAMPFKAVVEPAAETASEPSTAGSTEELPEAPLEENAEAGTGIPVIVFAAVAAAAVVAGAGTWIFLRKKKKHKPLETESKNDISPAPYEEDMVPGEIKLRGETEILGIEGMAGRSQETEIFVQKKEVRVALQDMREPANSFEYPLRDKVVIGKDRRRCQIVIDYNQYISGVHCELIMKGDSVYVRDGSGDVVASTNGTFVNDKRAIPELLLPSGAALRLGEVSFKVTYK